jgi:hypothetical protein
VDTGVVALRRLGVVTALLLGMVLAGAGVGTVGSARLGSRDPNLATCGTLAGISLGGV